MLVFLVFEGEIPRILSDSENLMGLSSLRADIGPWRSWWATQSPFLPTFHAMSEQVKFGKSNF